MSKGLRAGEYKHRVRIDGPTSVQQNTGEVIKSFAPISNRLFAAAIEPEQGAEGMIAGQVVIGSIFTRIRLHWAPLLANLGPSHKVIRVGLAGRNDVIYNIVAVVESNFERKEIVLRCTSGLNQG